MLLVLTLIAALVVPASLFSFAAEPTVLTDKGSKWDNAGFEDHHQPDGVWYVMWVDDTVGGPACWAAIKGDLENNKYTVTIDGTAYKCTTTSVYDGGEWGYLRFYLSDTGFEPEYDKTYMVSWTVEASDGSWAYTNGEATEVTCTCTNENHEPHPAPSTPETPETPDTPETPETPETPDAPKTGDMIAVAVMVSVIALAGAVIVSKKRITC